MFKVDNLLPLGTLVKNSGKTLAPFQIGRVVGCVTGYSYKAEFGSGLWETIFPGWEHKWVYFVELNEPSTRVRLELLNKNAPEYIKRKHKVLAFAYDDIIEVEE